MTCARHQEGKAAREVGVLFAEVCGFSYSLCFDPLSVYLACFNVFGVWYVVLWLLWVLWVLWVLWFLWLFPVPHTTYYACCEWLLMR